MTSSASAKSLQFPRWNYDVFLSFRGEDTRERFTSHLYQGLESRGMFTFQDDKRLEHGASISEELLRAIEESQVSVVIFSKNYASSSWCLDELVKIMECKDEYGQTVIPVFYDVDPSTIRYQKDSFGDAFNKHESRCKDDVEGSQKVKRWKAALTAAANLSGCDIRNRNESDCIQQIVDQISSKLCKISLSDLQDVVGINTHLEKVISLLRIKEINGPRTVGIWGMGGIGKTTIARAIVDTLSYQFEGSCFLADVKENKDGLHSLQNILLSELLREKVNYVNNVWDGKRLISRRLRFKKVLVVLDDIDSSDHLDCLAGDASWFGNGSRVVITTRDRHLIENDDAIYEVTTLPNDEAMQLFKQHAFKKKVPDEHFIKLSHEVVCHAKGLPLALKVWGSFLYKRDLIEWRSALEQMKINSDSKIVDKLKISYDGLEFTQQKIFLDIACFLRGEPKDKIIQILDSCDFGAHIGLRVLIDKSLVSISKDDRIEMHDLIQDMGKHIVNMQKSLEECSRIWLKEDFDEMMHTNMGTNAIEAIWVKAHEEPRYIKEAMENMKRLRILHISSLPTKGYEHRASAFGGRFSYSAWLLEYLSNNLRWCVWQQYPWESLPANFEPKKLVHLELEDNSLRIFQTGTKHFPSLRTLNLSHSTLMQSPDFTEMPNLEYLYMSGCPRLEEVHNSLGNCNKLISLDLNSCYNLKRFPCVSMESLECLNLGCCYRLEKFPEILGRVKPESEIGMTRSPKMKLKLSGSLLALPSSIGRLKSLVELDVSNYRLEILPEDIGDLENLEKLDASYSGISQPPPSIVRLNKLKFLSFARVGFVPDGVHCVFPPVAEGLRSLEELNLSYCNLINGGLPEDIGCLSSLRELNLKGNKFEHLPQSIAQLGALRSLDLSDCERLTQLPELPPELDELHVDCDMALKNIPILATKKNLGRIICRYGKYERDGAYLNLFAETLFQNISSLLHDISASVVLSQRVFTIIDIAEIPSWFHHQGVDDSISINLPKKWYECDNLLGVAVCYFGKLSRTKVQLIPLCNDGMTQELTLCHRPEIFTGSGSGTHFFFVPLVGLRESNGKTPNDYGLLTLSFGAKMTTTTAYPVNPTSGVWEGWDVSPYPYPVEDRMSVYNKRKFGFRLLYKDEDELEALL